MSSASCDRNVRLRAAIVAPLLAALCLAPGCGGGVKGGGADRPGEGPPRSGLASGMDDSSDREPEPPPKPKEQVQVTGTKGVLQAQEIQAGVAPHAAAIEACYKDELKQKKFVSGKLTVEILVAKTGQVGGARVVDSDVGDWAVEKCVLGVARGMTFAKPKGGDGQAQFQVPLNFSSDQPPLESWPEEQVAAAVAGKRAQLDACAGQAGGAAPAGVTVTFYVGNRGEVKAVGFASAAGKPMPRSWDAWADCAARAVSAWTMADPKGKIVKASFRYGAEGR
jgi:TonB family protein